jgi:hypothetical protein
MANNAPRCGWLALSGILIMTVVPHGASDRIQVIPNERAKRVDILIDGAPFTSYIYPSTLKKPVLYPIRTASGTAVTRGFPLEPRKGERVDHPHHVGLWFNHGDVNGLDFWNNSDEIGADRAPKMGTIVHRRVLDAKSGDARGELRVESEWLAPDGGALLSEETRFIFGGAKDRRSVERVTLLTARDRRVVLRDNKEGTIGLRVARALEQPSTTPEVFTDASGKPTAVPVLDNSGVTGRYFSSEGLQGDDVWGTRGRWVRLNGVVDGERVTLLMLDHPANPNSPTYWHARGYGLFAANPLGRHVFDDTQPELELALEPGRSVTFRHRVLILTGSHSAEFIESEYRDFAASR